MPTLKNLLHLFVFRKFRSLFHTRSRLSLSPPPHHSHCHSPTFSPSHFLSPSSPLSVLLGSGKFETNSLADVITIIFPPSFRFRVAIEFPRHAQRNGPARQLLGAHRSSIVEERGVPSRKVVRAICKILKNSTIFPEKSIHSTTMHSPHPHSKHPLIAPLSRTTDANESLSFSPSLSCARLSACSPVPNSMNFAVVSPLSFSFSLISKPYNFYTWHTPNMAGRQSLHLIKYSNRFCSLHFAS